MILENVWYKITSWFENYGERTKLIKSFNDKAKDSFVRGETPTVLRASSSKGISKNRHSFSSWLNTGFRIQALSGRALTKNEIYWQSYSFRQNISKNTNSFGLGYFGST